MSLGPSCDVVPSHLRFWTAQDCGNLKAQMCQKWLQIWVSLMVHPCLQDKILYVGENTNMYICIFTHAYIYIDDIDICFSGKSTIAKINKMCCFFPTLGWSWDYYRFWVEVKEHCLNTSVHRCNLYTLKLSLPVVLMRWLNSLTQWALGSI